MSLKEPLAAGIDIGGTKIAIGLVDRTGAILQRQSFATPRAFEEATAIIESALRELLHQCGGRELTGIGIGCAGPVDPKTGLVNNPYTLPGWEGCNLVTSLEQRMALPVFLENDADAALLGEAWTGAACGVDPVVMLTFGTGIGGAVLCRGAVFRGVRGEHPEIGHVPVVPPSEGPDCYCGRGGCLESIASGAGIEQAGKAFGFVSARSVFSAAASGDANARRILERAVEATACAAWALLHTFLPQRFVLGGGIIDEHFDLFASAFQRSIARAAMAPREHICVVKAALGNDAGVVGAASLPFAASPKDSSVV